MTEIAQMLETLKRIQMLLQSIETRIAHIETIAAGILALAFEESEEPEPQEPEP